MLPHCSNRAVVTILNEEETCDWTISSSLSQKCSIGLRKSWKYLSIILLLLVLEILVNQRFIYKSNDREWIYPDPVVARGAIVSTGGPCAAIGQKIMKKYGNAVDSIIATMLCDGLTCPHIMGLGGGFMATLYLKNESKAITIIAKETAPAASTVDMFTYNPALSLKGGLAVAVPGELKGYWEMYNRYGGKAPWKELFVDAIKMCEEGIPVNRPLADEIMSKSEEIFRTPAVRKMLENDRGELAKFGEVIKLPKLAKTFKIVAEEGADALYNGSLTAGFVKDIQDNGGIITEEDMNSYKIFWEEPVHVQLNSGINFYSVGPPGSGNLIGFILRVLNNILKPTMDSITNISIITETFKYAFAMRSYFGDPYYANISQILQRINDKVFIDEIKQKILSNKTSNDPAHYGAQNYDNEDTGTANIAVIAPNGDAISATSSINTYFGSWVVSESTGIILNSEMDDFSTPSLEDYNRVHPSNTNVIEPGKRPQSSFSPSILVDKNGNVCLVVGAAGGTRIITSTALTIIRNIWQNKPIAEAVDQTRFHHKFMPMVWYYEPSMPKEIVSDMKGRGHNVTVMGPIAVVTAIAKNGKILSLASDRRRPGNTSYLLFPCGYIC